MLEFLLQELELVVLGSDALANAVLKVFGVALIPVNLNTRCARVMRVVLHDMKFIFLVFIIYYSLLTVTNRS